MRLIQWLKDKRPSRDSLVHNRWTRPFAHTLSNPNIWHFNRHSVARGVALGLFCGILVPIGQSIVAALFAVPMRANLAIAALCTFITNPFTTPLVYASAYALGEYLVRDIWHPAGALSEVPLNWSMRAYDMLVYVPTGLFIIACLSSVLGYVAIQLLWRLWVRRRWRVRSQDRALRGVPQ